MINVQLKYIQTKEGFLTQIVLFHKGAFILCSKFIEIIMHVS